MAIHPDILRRAQELMAARRAGDSAKLAEITANLTAKTTAATAAAQTAAIAAADAASSPAAFARAVSQVTNPDLPPTPAFAAAINLAAITGGRQPNERQQLAIDLALQGRSYCLIGAAGTGKTTSLRWAISAILQAGLVPPLASSTKWLRRGAPGIVCVAYTRRAVRQIAKNVPAEVTTLTAHKLLEFAPVYYEVEKPDGGIGKTMRFEPQRHATNPLPKELHTLIIDESSMMSLELYDLLMAAIQHNVQVILLGDLHQLPPVYGQSVLADKLTQWPVVELTEVYRQALDSPIIQLATAIKDGRGWTVEGKTSWASPDGSSTVTINPWKSSLRSHDDGHVVHKVTALDGFKGFADSIIAAGDYSEEEDVILMPFNKACGTLELNKHIANTLGRKRGAQVHHVIAGYNNHFFAVGDRVLYEKQEAVIVAIEPNPVYVGKAVQPAGYSLDRWGGYSDDAERQAAANAAADAADPNSFDVDTLLANLALMGEDDDKFNQASHIISLLTIEQIEEGRAAKERGDADYEEPKPLQVKDTGAINNMLFAYALTIHKSQGSEWRRVFLFLHQSHHTMCSRELLYTAVTRARQHLYIICEPDKLGKPGTVTKAARAPRIRGNTLAEKVAWLQQEAAKNAQEAL